MTGRLIGHYEILDELGAGGMGVVYKARDARLRRLVAIKIISQTAVRSERARARFLREAQAASALNHPNIVSVFDIGQVDEMPYMVMELAEGRPLNRLIPPRGIGLPQAHAYAVQLAEGLAAAHAQNILHRDLKPGNIIVSPEGRVKILDFGLAKFLDDDAPAQTEPGACLGTVGYLSPELAMGGAVDVRSDIFSLGVVMFEMITGALPFAGATQWAIVESIINGQRPSIRSTHPYYPESLDTLLKQMLSKSAAERPAATSVAAALYRMSETELTAVLKGTETVIAPLPDYLRGTRVPPSSHWFDTQHESAPLAVLPFRSIYGGKEESQITDGIVAELVRALSGIPGVALASPISSIRLKQAGNNITEVAQSLNVQYLLTGSVRQAGSKLRVIAELDDTNSGLQLWCQSYDRIVEDLFGVSEELAEVIAAAVSGQIIRVRAKRATFVPDDTADAMTLVRRTYHSLNAAYHPEALFEAVRILRRAIKLDSNMALAHAFLGFFIAQLIVNNVTTSVEADRTEAYQSVQTAIRLAPSDPEVLENSGLVLMHCGRHEQAEQALRRSVEIAPLDLVAWGYLALFLGWAGETQSHIEEAHAILDRISAKAPDHPSLPYWFYFKSGIYARQLSYENALEFSRRSVLLQPRLPISLVEYANALGVSGRLDEAREIAAQTIALNPRASQDSYMRELIITVGNRERAEPHIRGLIAAGIFKGDTPWPVESKPSLPSVRVLSM